jgi:methyl-accepting chemotaxis protein
MFSVSKGAGLAELRLGGKTLNDQFAEVDRFTARSGAVATFFVKDGDDFYRVSTSVKKADGSRAVGTPLGKAHPAYAKLMAGERFSGLANLFGKDFVTDYKPIKDSGGQVIGATFVGVDATDEMAALKSKLRSVKVGDTGYMYVLNSKPGDKYGTLIVHPAKEGQNIIDAKDASGREFIKDIMEAKSGVAVRYPWLNAEKGETTPRMKIVVTEKFDEWGWAISGGTYIDEFEKETRVVFWLLGSSLLVAVLVLAGVVSVVMRRNITEPLQQVNSAFDRIIQGDFSSQLAVNRHDEIGDMFRSLITMQTQTGFNIIETKRASDEMARIKIGLYSSTAAVTISDVNGLLIHATPAADVMFTAAFGTTATDLIGKKLTETVLTDPKVQADMADAVLRGHEMDVVVGDSHLRLAARPIRLASGETLGRVTTWQDRTNEVMVEKEVESIVYAAAQGDFSRRLALEGKTGFFLSLANGLNTLLETSATGLEEVADVLGSLAQGDLSRQVGGDYQGTFGQLKDDTNLTINQLKNIIQSIQESSEAINTAAKEIAAGNTDLSSRTEEQASSLEETASSMEQLSGTVKQNAANASDAHRVAEVSRQSVEDGGVVFSQLVETMKDIHTSSSKITDIIGVIDGIAFQTNILALNAAVEAARAGEQGRGFAVVATEVRSLAQRSAAAAKEIKTLIEASSSKVAEGTHLVSDASKAMESVQNSIVRVARLIGDIASASVEQSSGIGQVSLAISQMDEVTQQNAALVEEAAAAAESLEDQAQTLTEAVSVFRLEAGGNGGNSGGQGGRVSASKPAVSSHRPTASRAQTAARTSTAARSSSKAAPSVSDEGDEWAEF